MKVQPPQTQEYIDAAAAQLAGAMTSGDVLPVNAFSVPANLEVAEAIQDRMLERLGWRPAAWKLGATTHAARNALGLPRSFSAPLPANRLLQSPAQLGWELARQPGAECEVAVRLARALARSTTEIISLGENELVQRVRESIAGVHAAIETPETRFLALGAAGGLSLVADNGAAGWITSPINIIANGASALAEPLVVELYVDGRIVAHGDSGAFCESPLHLLVDHIRRMALRGHLLGAGQVVLLGSVTPRIELAPGSTVVAKFKGLEPAELTLTAAAA